MFMILRRNRPIASSRGVSLIEVLVALLVFTLGVLAVVALQMVSKRNNVDSAQRALAAQLAYDLIERIRANSSAVPTNALKAYLDFAANGLGRGRQGTEPSPHCSDADTNACAPDQLARHDLWVWEQQLDGALEQVTGTTQNAGGLAVPTACLTADPPGGTSATYTVTIAWRSPAKLPDNPDPTIACGRGTGLYGTNNEFRRTVTVQAFVASR